MVGDGCGGDSCRGDGCSSNSWDGNGCCGDDCGGVVDGGGGVKTWYLLGAKFNVNCRVVLLSRRSRHIFGQIIYFNAKHELDHYTTDSDSALL